MPIDDDLPALPYAGTSGWSGSETSRERAEHDDGSGTTSKRQSRTRNLLYGAAMWGSTWKELADRTGWHHGQASGVLSTLHKTGQIERLTERRGRCAVYVMPCHVMGRETSAHGRNRQVPVLTVEEQEAAGRLREMADDQSALSIVQSDDLLAVVEAITRLNT